MVGLARGRVPGELEPRAQLRPIIAGAGVHYRLDLCNEAVPAPNQTLLLAYTQRLWTDYTHVHGKEDTLGFSIIADPARITSIGTRQWATITHN